MSLRRLPHGTRLQPAAERCLRRVHSVLWTCRAIDTWCTTSKVGGSYPQLQIEMPSRLYPLAAAELALAVRRGPMQSPRWDMCLHHLVWRHENDFQLLLQGTQVSHLAGGTYNRLIGPKSGRAITATMAGEIASGQHNLSRKPCHALGLMWQPALQDVDQKDVLVTRTAAGAPTVWFAPEGAGREMRASRCSHGGPGGVRPCYGPYPVWVLADHPGRKLPDDFGQPEAPPALLAEAKAAWLQAPLPSDQDIKMFRSANDGNRIARTLALNAAPVAGEGAGKRKNLGEEGVAGPKKTKEQNKQA